MWPKLTWHRDAPISEPADVAIFRLASLARQSVKVLLSGEGADELFAGYPKYRFARWAGLSSSVPASLRRPLFRFLERSTPENFARVRIMLRAMSAASESDRFQTWFAPFTAYERDALITGEERSDHRELGRASSGDVIQRMLFVDCHTWLSDNLLERGDRMAMAASVESRPPFLDHNLVELAFRLPSNVKVRNGRGKWVLKEVARQFLPEKIVDRRKVGFRVPLDAWFREGLREFSADLLLAPNSFVSEVFDRAAVDALVRDHLEKRRNEEIRIWTLMCLEIWHRVHYRNAGRVDSFR
jgi:asparagine synthase (glutamine-hydrolysing)